MKSLKEEEMRTNALYAQIPHATFQLNSYAVLLLQ